MRNSATLDALVVSAKSSVGAMVLSILLGLPTAWILARRPFPGRDLVRTLLLVPMVLPPVVGGLALLYAFGPKGMIGGWIYDQTGESITLTIWAAIIAATFIAMPVFIVTAEAAFRTLDQGADDTAATLGASPLYRFFKVTVPSVAPALSAGAAMCFARALGEFGATALFAGDFPGRTETMPLLIYSSANIGDNDSAIALSFVLLVLSIGILFLLRDRWKGE